MSQPQRLRLGGNLYNPVTPPGAVSIVRPGRWGNPHRVNGICKICDEAHSVEDAVNRFWADLHAGRGQVSIEDVRRELAGKDLACWCRVGDLCHGEILIELANENWEIRRERA